MKKLFVLGVSVLLLMTGCDASASNNAEATARDSIEAHLAETNKLQSEINELQVAIEKLEEAIIQKEEPFESLSDIAESTVLEKNVEGKNLEATSFTLETAKERFASEYPSMSIEIAKTQGNTYYVEGVGDGLRAKMKFRIHDEAVLLNKSFANYR